MYYLHFSSLDLYLINLRRFPYSLLVSVSFATLCQILNHLSTNVSHLPVRSLCCGMCILGPALGKISFYKIASQPSLNNVVPIWQLFHGRVDKRECAPDSILVSRLSKKTSNCYLRFCSDVSTDAATLRNPGAQIKEDD